MKQHRRQESLYFTIKFAHYIIIHINIELEKYRLALSCMLERIPFNQAINEHTSKCKRILRENKLESCYISK